MSTDPGSAGGTESRPPSPPEAPSAALPTQSPAADPAPPTQSPAADPARPAGSRLLARLLTVVYALVITPVATGLISYGGGQWFRITQQRSSADGLLPAGVDATSLVGPLLALAAGILLVASVAASGIASSAGLLAAGVLGLFSVATSAFPPLLQLVYGIASPVIPWVVLDGLTFGLTPVLHMLLGGLGLSLLLARRRPTTGLPAALVGLLLIPVLLAVGPLLMFQGQARGALIWAQTFQATVSPGVVLLVLGGVLLLVLAAGATRWSPYALVIPALALLALSMIALLSTGVIPFAGTWWTFAAGLPMIFIATGGAAAAAVAMLVHTGVLAIVRSRSARAPGRPAVPGGPGANG